jgi:hypothetical protein
LFNGRTADFENTKINSQSKGKSQKQGQEREFRANPLTATVYQWEVCSLATSVAKKTG